MAGPWFTVLDSGSDWQSLDTITLSNGASTAVGRVDVRVRLEDAYETVE